MLSMKKQLDSIQHRESIKLLLEPDKNRWIDFNNEFATIQIATKETSKRLLKWSEELEGFYFE